MGQVNDILWCNDCMSKHSADLLQHAKVKKNSELKKLAERAFDVASDMADVRDKKEYLKIRGLEHRAEDLLVGLRTERKKITGCKDCDNIENALKPLNREASENIIKEEDIMRKPGKESSKIVGNALMGNAVGEGISRVTPMIIPAGSMVGIPNKSLANLVIGLGLTGAALYSKLGKMNLAGAVAGSNLLVKEVADTLMGYMAPIPTPPPATAVARAAGKIPANGALYRTTIGTTGAGNGSLVYID